MYRRILIKLSGESLAGRSDKALEPQMLSRMAREIGGWRRRVAAPWHGC